MSQAMKAVPCSYADCGKRRIHWCEPETERGTQTVNVPIDYHGPAYCSIECACYAGAAEVKGHDQRYAG
jgi:hypothetical protein